MRIKTLKQRVLEKREHLNNLLSCTMVKMDCQILRASRNIDPCEWYGCMNKWGLSRVDISTRFQEISKDIEYLSCLEAINELGKEEVKLSRRLNKRVVLQKILEEGVEYDVFQLTLYGFPPKFVEKYGGKRNI